jgi:hypothetical protein
MACITPAARDIFWNTLPYCEEYIVMHAKIKKIIVHHERRHIGAESTSIACQKQVCIGWKKTNTTPLTDHNRQPESIK